MEAVKYFADNRPRKSPDITVRQAVDELLDLKQREGEVGKLHLRDLRNRLGRFAAKFNCPISKVSSNAIREYILEQPVSTRTRHNLRTTLATLFKFAANEGYLPADHKGVPRPVKHKRMKLAVQVFSLEEMAKLLHAAKGDQLVALAIGGFAGIRAEEIKRLHWEHLNFEEGHIVVPDSVAKCQERRIVPMTENLMAWLLPLRRKSGPVCPFSNLAIVFQRTAKRAGIVWKRNGLRHSFISYRVAMLKNVAQIPVDDPRVQTAKTLHRDKNMSITTTVRHNLFGLSADQRSGKKSLHTLVVVALSVKQTHFQRVCTGNKRNETNTISDERGNKVADDCHTTSGLNRRHQAHHITTFLADHQSGLAHSKDF